MSIQPLQASGCATPGQRLRLVQAGVRNRKFLHTGRSLRDAQGKAGSLSEALRVGIVCFSGLANLPLDEGGVQFLHAVVQMQLPWLRRIRASVMCVVSEQTLFN